MRTRIYEHGLRARLAEVDDRAGTGHHTTSAKWLACKLRVSLSAVCTWRTGRRRPRDKTIARIADLLGLRPVEDSQ